MSSLALAACGSQAATVTTTSTTSAIATTTTTVPIMNLSITPAVIKSLLDSAAAYHQLPPTDYTGLDPGMTYYAFDPTTSSYYAAAGLIPSQNSLQAEIGAQDDGGYNLFIKTASASNWTVFNDGLGASQDAICPLAIPASVLAVWNWKPKSCFPPL
jgi:hypothetical protein